MKIYCFRKDFHLYKSMDNLEANLKHQIISFDDYTQW